MSSSEELSLAPRGAEAEHYKSVSPRQGLLLFDDAELSATRIGANFLDTARK